MDLEKFASNFTGLGNTFLAVLFVSQLSRFFYKAVTICLFVFINASNQYLLKS